MSKETITKTDLWRYRPAEYFKDCLKIEHKATGKITQFEPNTHQQKMQEVIDRQRRTGRPIRIRVLKPRQTGVTTESSANVFHGCRFTGGTSMIVSKDLDSTEHIFGITQRFYYYLPDSEKKVLVTQASNRKELKFAPPHGGRIIVDTAGKSGAGHSFTIRHLLLSEVSRWPEGCEDTIVGLLNAVPYEPDTSIIIESVANGASGWFYDEWRKTGTDYENIFLPWFEHNEYSRELPIDRLKYEASLTQEERQLMSRHELKVEQIEWRRWAIANNCQDNPEKFKEQYPATAHEAFIVSGNSFFNSATVEAIESIEPLQGDLREYEDAARSKQLTFASNQRGSYKIGRASCRERVYVLV